MFAEADGGFDGEFVKGVEGVFEVRGVDGGASGIDVGFYLEFNVSLV